MHSNRHFQKHLPKPTFHVNIISIIVFIAVLYENMKSILMSNNNVYRSHNQIVENNLKRKLIFRSHVLTNIQDKLQTIVK